MNSSEACHEILDCPGLYVDAFRGRYLKRTCDPDNAFILSHYHGDHYQSLPREGKYQGPALIYCTPVTAALLVQVHQVPPEFVVEHGYGETFEFKINGKGRQTARVTFYDANHCPGACIILIQLPNGTTHLHTGDMRYHEQFQSYPLLRQAVLERKLDLVYLDTTYSHPKHDFVPQEEAVEAIASQTESLLNEPEQSTLVMLSCYSIGKEKVLWEASTRTNQLVYVAEKKYKMLQCIQGHESQVSSQIIHRCTQNASESDIHVIPMGFAGEMWPYFRPNFQKCADYVEKLDKDYDRVVAFLPTGWASASKWNKEHACEKKSVELSSGRSLDVEVRLISYSEHSAFSELVSFVQYLRPRKVVPTVFSDDSDCRKIENRFRNMLDAGRAKKAFFRSMEEAANKSTPVVEKKQSQSENKGGNGADSEVSETLDAEKGEIAVGQTCKIRASKFKSASDDEIEVVAVKSPPVVSSQPRSADTYDDKIIALTAMGFHRSGAKESLEKCKGDLDSAIELLLSQDGFEDKQRHGDSKTKRHSEQESSASSVSPSKRQKQSSSPLITSFFSRKRPGKELERHR
jgi:L-ascorbate metabolism protein UlaG (beta-lactamase superfamily)